jgi:molecular chaperone DnaJ
MKNPYEVLGIPSNSNIDDVKKAYREMARKYSGNQYKMDEINNAYDVIIMNFGNSNAANSYNANAQNNTGGGSEFGDIRAKLNNGRIDDAEMLLDGIPLQRRTAEWYYLKGTIQHRRGWLESAAESFERAKNMEPGNPEYQAAYNELHREKGGGRRNQPQKNDNDDCMSPCNICSSLICADCCCECMGGDLIRCC